MKISVVIPALNEAENILSCLNSVKNQYCEFEVIVVDGRSTELETLRPRSDGRRGRLIYEIGNECSSCN